MKIPTCACGELQWSLFDREYLRLHGTCWQEDCEAWGAGKLSLKEFEWREEEAFKASKV